MIGVLADENIPRGVVDALRLAGFDVTFVLEVAPRTEDRDVVAWATRENRLLVTCDVELASATLRLGTRHRGTLLLRVDGQMPTVMAELAVETLLEERDWNKLHCVLTAKKLRTKPLVVFDDL